MQTARTVDLASVQLVFQDTLEGVKRVKGEPLVKPVKGFSSGMRVGLKGEAQ
jgi:hypothetical protein